MKKMKLYGYEVEKSININDNYYYMNLVLGDNKKYVIIDLEEVKDVKEFNNKYLYIWKVK